MSVVCPLRWVAILACAAAACADDPTENEPPLACPAVVGIRITPATVSLAVGASVTFTARYFYYGGASCQLIELDGPFAWSSSDTDVAQVDSGGRATGRKLGQAAVTVAWLRDTYFRAAANVSVVP